MKISIKKQKMNSLISLIKRKRIWRKRKMLKWTRQIPERYDVIGSLN
jgi:hypothetical protein